MPHVWQEMSFGTVDFLSLPVAVLLLAALALTFDFTNGIHDAANSVATVVSTRVLSPWTAVLWAAFVHSITAEPPTTRQLLGFLWILVGDSARSVSCRSAY